MRISMCGSGLASFAPRILQEKIGSTSQRAAPYSHSPSPADTGIAKKAHAFHSAQQKTEPRASARLGHRYAAPQHPDGDMNMESLSHPAAYRINAPRVAHQTLDGETIIIDFGSGSYFSTNHTGAVIWQHIDQNASVNQIIRILSQQHTGSEDAIRHQVEQFLAQLQDEALIAPLDDAPAPSDLAFAIAEPTATAERVFQAPSISKYNDMSDLLLLDAIHDVDDQGWPLKPAQAAE